MNLIAQGSRYRYYLRHFEQPNGQVKFHILEYDFLNPKLAGKMIWFGGKVLKHGRLFDSFTQARKYLNKYLQGKKMSVIEATTFLSEF